MKNTSEAQYWIEKLRLVPHPEGGYFRQTYKSELMVEAATSKGSDPGESHSFARNVKRVGRPEICGARAASTAIYFLLEGENFSAFHRLRSDEMWHFYAGSALIVHVIDAEGEYSSILLGNDAERGEVFQAVVKAGCWFASEIARDSLPSAGSDGGPTSRKTGEKRGTPPVGSDGDPTSRETGEKRGTPLSSQYDESEAHPTYALVGCTVAPGFEFEDFELARREELARAHPRHRKLIERLTRG